MLGSIVAVVKAKGAALAAQPGGAAKDAFLLTAATALVSAGTPLAIAGASAGILPALPGLALITAGAICFGLWRLPD